MSGLSCSDEFGRLTEKNYIPMVQSQNHLRYWSYMQIIRRLTITAASFTYVPGEYIEQFQQKEETSTMICTTSVNGCTRFLSQHHRNHCVNRSNIDRHSRSTLHPVPLRYKDDVTGKKIWKKYTGWLQQIQPSTTDPTKNDKRIALLVLRSTIRKESVPWHFGGSLSPQHYLLHAASCTYDEPTHLPAHRFVRSQGKSATAFVCKTRGLANR